MKTEFKGIFISALIFCIFTGISEGAPQIFIDLNSATTAVDSFYAPAKDSIFTVGLYVSNIESLYSYQCYMQFDTTKLRYISSSKVTTSAPHLMETSGQSVNFQSNKSISRNDRILMGGYYLSQIPGASGSGYLGVVTFLKLTIDSVAINIAEPIFLNPSEVNITISSVHSGLILPPGSISVHKRSVKPSNFNFQISNRTIHCTLSSKLPAQIRLLDIGGRSIYEKRTVSQNISLNLPETGSGVYMLYISNSQESFAYTVVLK